jgi:hypothetical protein
VTLSAGSQSEFEKLTHQLSDAASSGIVAEIFDALSGGAAENESSQS